MEGFGKRLVIAREKMGFTQKKLAELLDITPTRLNYWEKDKREPDFFMFTKIINILNADANELLGIKKNDIVNVHGLNGIGIAKVNSYVEDLKNIEMYTQKNSSDTICDFDSAVDVTETISTHKINKD